MSTKNKIVMYLSFLLLFVLGIIIYTTTSSAGDVVVIKSDGKIIKQINLNSVTSEYEMKVENQGYNLLKISSEGVMVCEADCPDKLCIEQSNSGTYPIICLPHKLVIEKK